ncbi:DUF5610 domain-containing protein [Salinimonas marina]|uniref:DUF5610 domain-containing protein n=1 Tax=Salinimonas marina TaxID=2785918 RepID=A0A7S9DYB9_9ALTE|nr:DUF5610 domain-containing protein [Salinimonas marina]QPG06113.1 DUF5610 domain-containing protein [Salinimonas marina]
MNVDKFNNTVADPKTISDPVKTHRKQLQEQGLQQAAQFSQQETSVTMTASQNRVSYKVVSQSMAANLVVDGQRPGKPDPLPEETSMFDFEKVARNVMGFVGGVIRGAAAGGAPDEKLQNLFGQAREGVAKGIAMARQDLGQWLNDDINLGINKSEALIGEQMGTLEEEVLGANPLSNLQVNAMALSQQQQRSGDLVIRTREGDEVSIRFGDTRRASYERYDYQQGGQYTDSGTTDNTVGAVNSGSYTNVQWQTTSHFSFSVDGDLNEQELKSITQLINSTTELTELFFDGDIDKAFEQAQNLEFDKASLAGFALKLTQSQSSSMAKAYGSVQELTEKPDNAHQNAAIAEYVEKALSTQEQAKATLAGEKEFSNLVQGIINHMHDVHVPDLISAINRFNQFNQKIIQAVEAD